MSQTSNTLSLETFLSRPDYGTFAGAIRRAWEDGTGVYPFTASRSRTDTLHSCREFFTSTNVPLELQYRGVSLFYAAAFDGPKKWTPSWGIEAFEMLALACSIPCEQKTQTGSYSHNPKAFEFVDPLINALIGEWSRFHPDLYSQDSIFGYTEILNSLVELMLIRPARESKSGSPGQSVLAFAGSRGWYRHPILEARSSIIRLLEEVDPGDGDGLFLNLQLYPTLLRIASIGGSQSIGTVRRMMGVAERLDDLSRARPLAEGREQEIYDFFSLGPNSSPLIDTKRILEDSQMICDYLGIRLLPEIRQARREPSTLAETSLAGLEAYNTLATKLETKILEASNVG
ncbi:hypothetical protein [uncultured Tateyamaria sp.]|uniref:hypothetical protein n=1 Tax=uncultured Tateyamaria sp. TaxID=455651 RepID=UPI0026383DFE|nr:hypothetical protein [uncultured Tateyamaria sp.]